MILLNTPTPRLRMFAGPNGSGKSTIKAVIRKGLLGFDVNPDEIEAEIKEYDFLDFNSYGIQTNKTEVLGFLQSSTLLEHADLLDEAEYLRFNENRLTFSEVGVNASFASVAADFIRQKLIASRQPFSLETMLLLPDEVELLQTARQHGYSTYLYYVATDDPLINISRVRHRARMGGLNVPADYIKARYYRSLDLLWEAVKSTSRAYIFDNSGSQIICLAEITDGENLEIKADAVPIWFKTFVLDKA